MRRGRIVVEYGKQYKVELNDRYVEMRLAPNGIMPPDWENQHRLLRQGFVMLTKNNHRYDVIGVRTVEAMMFRFLAVRHYPRLSSRHKTIRDVIYMIENDITDLDQKIEQHDKHGTFVFLEEFHECIGEQSYAGKLLNRLKQKYSYE